MIEVEKLQALAQHLDIEFDPDVCQISKHKPYARLNTAAIGEVDDTRYAEFRIEPFIRPTYYPNPVSGIVDEDLSAKYDQVPDYDLTPDPDDDHDQSLHGLIESRKGHVAFYSPYKSFESLYQFHTTNGPGGANALHQTLGRAPGVDIPKFELSHASTDRGGVFTAGQITEALADMKILTTGVNDFYFAEHDLGCKNGAHGPSWPHTTPAVYRQLSRVAQDTVEQYGDRIHETHLPEILNRPAAVVTIAKTLDRLIDQLKPTIDSIAIMELRIRDGRYDEVSDEDIMNSLLAKAFERASQWQGHTATGLLIASPEAPESERYRRGYWIGMQQVAGVVDTRLALHEVQPHPEATDAQTLRALKVLNIFKTELNRRFSYNKDQLLAA